MFFRHAFFVALFLVTGALSASAEDQTASAIKVSASDKAACMPDALRLCRNAIPNVQNVLLCFGQNRDKISDRCRVAIRDYRTLTDSDGYDKIASVGMIEHVGLSHLPVYFASVFRALKAGGLFLNHGIVSLREARPKSIKENVEWIMNSK